LTGVPIRKLPKAALIYGVGDLLPKMATVLLLPLLTRVLSPGEYGTFAAVTAFALVLGLVLQLSLSGALFRFYQDCRDDAERSTLVGSLLLLALGWSLAVVAGLNLFGARVLDRLFQTVRFEPYLRIGTWLAFFNSIPALPLAMLQARERPVLYRALTFTSFLLSTGGMLAFVLAVRPDAVGALTGQTLGAGLATIPYLIAVRRYLRLRPAGPVIAASLLFCLPLAAYAVGGWVVDGANRVFIERFLSVADLGRFSAASQLALGLGFVLNAVGLAYSPLFYETARLDSGRVQLARFALVYLAGTLGLALALAVFAREALQLLTAPRYHSAYRLVPILAATQCLTCVWQLVANPLFLQRRTSVLAAVMLASAGFSLGLNLWLVPRLGLAGAALASLGAGLFLNAVVGAISLALYPVPYDYRRIGLLLLLAAGTYAATRLVPSEPALLSIPLRALVLALYPLLFVPLGLVERASVQQGFLWLRHQVLR
jgi:O-antigen/teichoic acid export membrane protein